MSDSKYIRFRSKGVTDPFYDFCVIFPQTITHADMAIGMSGNYAPISAGFVASTAGIKDARYPVVAYGESTSLGMKSQEDDSRLLYRTLHGILG